MGIVEQFSNRQAKKTKAQGEMGDYDWNKYEQAQQPEQYPLPTGQTLSMEDVDEALHDPWEMYYTYAETVAIPQITETQKVLTNLDRSIPGEMLPVPGDPVDLPKLYPETIKNLDIIKNYLGEKLPASQTEIREFMQKNQDQELQQSLDLEKQIEDQMAKPPKSRMDTRRTVQPSEREDASMSTEYPTSRLGISIAKLFAERRR